MGKRGACNAPAMHLQAMSAMAAGNMKIGDWICTSCGDHQFAKNEACRRCRTPKPRASGGGKGFCGKGYGHGGKGMMQAKGYGGVMPMGANVKPGDWQCPKCGDHQFAKNTQCRQCSESKPVDSLQGNMLAMAMGNVWLGDWECPKCKDHQFAKNEKCRKCGSSKPGLAESKQVTEEVSITVSTQTEEDLAVRL
jgi:predicted RNA-binding Zn-ribbon protein involved in translation (DUF1610 family)